MVHEIHNIIQDLVRTVIVKLTGNNYALVFRQKTLQKSVNEVPDNLFVRKKIPVNNFMYGLQFCEDSERPHIQVCFTGIYMHHAHNIVHLLHVFSFLSVRDVSRMLREPELSAGSFFLSFLQHRRTSSTRRLLPVLPTAQQNIFHAYAICYTATINPAHESYFFLRGADKSLALPARKQANVSVRMA